MMIGQYNLHYTPSIMTRQDIHLQTEPLLFLIRRLCIAN